MKPNGLLLGVAAFVLSPVGGRTIAAQSVVTLVADRYELAAGEELEVRFSSRRAGVEARSGWPEDIDWFLVRVGGGQRNLRGLRPARPADDVVPLGLVRPGVTLVAVDLAPRIEEVAPGELRAFLESKLGPATLPADADAAPAEPRVEAVRVRRVESSKILARVVGEDGWLPGSAVAQSKTGQRVEIRPLGDPSSVRARTDLPVRVYVPWPEKRGSKVIARHVQSGEEQSFTTDRFGTGFFTVTRAGLWRVEVHHARRLAADPAADWEIASATLAFEVPAWDPREGESGKRKR